MSRDAHELVGRPAVGRDAAVRARSPRAGTPSSAMTDAPVRSSAAIMPSSTCERLVHDVVAEQHRRTARRRRACGPPTRRGRGRAARPGGRSGCRPARRAPASRSSSLVLPGLLEVVLELEVAVEVVLERPLAAAGDDEDVVDAGRAPPPRPRTGSPACRRPAASPWAAPSSPAGTGCRARPPGSRPCAPCGPPYGEPTRAARPSPSGRSEAVALALGPVDC